MKAKKAQERFYPGSYVRHLHAEVKAAWITACEAEGIPADAKFVVFGNTVEAANYNELAGILLRVLKARAEQGYETAVL